MKVEVKPVPKVKGYYCLWVNDHDECYSYNKKLLEEHAKDITAKR